MKATMKTTRNRPVQALSFLHQGLLIFLAALAFIIIGGTIYGVFFHNPRHQNETIPQASGESGGRHIFTGIGLRRVSTADPQPGTVVLFFFFFYFPDDRAFSEELALRVKDFRETITDYIGSLSASELHNLGEENLKTELLRRFNNILRLGQIETIYLSDFMIVD
jgi:flagellar basal body-associated protein FliL